MTPSVARAVAIATAVLAAGCGLGAMRRVPLDAAPATWERLSGEWRGDYTLEGRSRRGRIEFRLKAAEREAFGDVLMIMGDRTRAESQLLSIRFVSADDGRVRGAMEPYWDRERKCTARAVFLGSVDGDVIAGTLTTACEDNVRVLEGRWRVTRSR